MDSVKDLMKNGWHPEKQGTTLKGQVSSLMGRNKGSSSSADRSNHVSRPLANLKDPSSFAPPPRRSAAAAAAAPPSLPPRLPPRRLSAGPQKPAPPGPAAAQPNPGAVNRFAKLPASSLSGSPAAPPRDGTTWAQKQAAVKTAASLHKGPSSVSLSDAKAAASTANNFRQRHGDQVAAGISKANSLNQKYGIVDKIGAYAATHGQGQGGQPGQPGQPGQATTAGPASSGNGSPPATAAKKKPRLGGSASLATDAEPPPIPMSTRPAF